MGTAQHHYRIVDKDAAVLGAVLTLEKKIFKKNESWGDLFHQELAKRNTHLLVCTAPSPASSEATCGSSEPVADAASARVPSSPADRRQPSPASAGRGSTATRGKQGRATSSIGRHRAVSTSAEQPAAEVEAELLGYCVFTTNSLVLAINKIAVHPDHRCAPDQAA